MTVSCLTWVLATESGLLREQYAVLPLWPQVFVIFFLNIPPRPSQQSGAELCISQDCSTQQKEKKKPIVNLTFPSANNISLSQYEESHCWKHTASEPSERTLNGRKNTRMGAWRHPGRMLSWCSANSIRQDRLQQSRPL